MRKIPPDAFDFYLSLGTSRSYESVARRYGVSKRAVVKLAMKDGWQARALEIEAKARTASTEKAVESIEAMNTRHLKSLRVIQGKALEALKAMPIDSAMDAVRAIDIAIRQERTICGEPGDRAVISVEDTIKREFSRWMVSGDDEESELEVSHAGEAE